MILLAFTLFACKDDEKTGDSIIGEWQAVKIVTGGVDTPIDNCNGQTRLVITNDRFTYYKHWKNGDNCNSQIDDYDYFTEVGEKDKIKKRGDTSHYYTCILENGGSRLRVVYFSDSYAIFKRK
ncbi:lipocalin-like domain-containing protein [Capnocytophaga sp. HP1101]